MFNFLLLIILFTFPHWAKTLSGPKRPPWMDWVNELATIHIMNMTEEIYKDVIYKAKHAEKIRDLHKSSITFELGSVAAGIQERFYRMLNMYRKYANPAAFKSERWTVEEVMTAYHIIQGDYNEIRHEKSLYHDIVRQHESSTASKTRWTIPSGKPTGKLRQAMRWKAPEQPVL